MGASPQEKAQKLANDANIQMTDSTNQANRDIAKETNQANRDIAQMNNQYNRESLERQIDEQWKMWHAENEYNSASAQRARIEEAGLNPYMMMSGGSAGTASSMSAPSAAPADTSGTQQTGAPMVPGHVEPVFGMDRLQKMVQIIDAIKGVASSAMGFANDYQSYVGQGLENYKTRAAMPDYLATIRGNAQVASAQGYFASQSEGLKMLGVAMDNNLKGIASIANAYSAALTMKEFQNYDMNQQLSIASKVAEVFDRYNQGEISYYKAKRELLNYNFQKDTYNDELRIKSAEATHAENNTGPDNELKLAFDLFSKLVEAYRKDGFSGVGDFFKNFQNSSENSQAIPRTIR
uniref:DNA pilot protein VP2 n=1 Tax=Microviridae sp. ctCoW18 TaxID=2826730 RepID=A0A8S5NQU4_9VIRU|nr:MAG TPA: DNA pilot protein VP2 [Microviridae sp. ctCoW18]